MRHFTVTLSPGILVNLLDPHLGQIGQDRTGSISNQRNVVIGLEKL